MLKLVIIDKSELRSGEKEEAEEHGFDPQTAHQVAIDHLTKKDPHYYTKAQAAGLEDEEKLEEAKAPKKAKYKVGFNKKPGKKKQPKNRAGPQGIPTGKKFPFTQKSGRLWKIKAAAKKGPITVVGGSGIGESVEID